MKTALEIANQILAQEEPTTFTNPVIMTLACEVVRLTALLERANVLITIGLELDARGDRVEKMAAWLIEYNATIR